MNNIALFGATGPTGLEVVKQASAFSEYELISFVRNPQPVLELNPRAKINKFSIDSTQDWKQGLKDCSTWICIIGISGLWAARKPNALYERTAKMLITLAEEFQPKRVIVVTSGGVVEGPHEPWILRAVLKPLFLNPMYDDMRKMETMLKNSAMPFVVVRPPYLTKGKKTAQYRLIVDDWFKDDKTLSRADLAHFLLQLATQPDQYHRNFIGISY